MGGAGVPTTGEETDDMLPMNPEGYKVDDAQVQCGHLLTNAHIGQTPKLHPFYSPIKFFKNILLITLFFLYIGS
ncbi:hypothetical protein Mjas_08355 [Methanothermococcus sp. Ax23]|uniref:hypothetical protein n=1 Tax=Methanothermococcus sp. Ax23 TaxID=3156486 RepID=UPI003B9DC9EF